MEHGAASSPLKSSEIQRGVPIMQTRWMLLFQDFSRAVCVRVSVFVCVSCGQHDIVRRSFVATRRTAENHNSLPLRQRPVRGGRSDGDDVYWVSTRGAAFGLRLATFSPAACLAVLVKG